MLRLNVARRVAFAAVPRIAPLRHYTKDVPGGASFDRRERSLEDKVVRDHEKALLDDLVAQLAKKDAQLKAAQQSLKDQGVAPANTEHISTEMDDKILAFRKEMRGEIHALEDRLAELDFRIKRLEKRII